MVQLKSFMCKLIFVWAFCLGWTTQNARHAIAQTAYPMLMSISPVSAQSGTTSLHTFRSRYSMADAYQVWVSGQGVQGEVVPEEKVDAKGKPASGETLTVRFVVAADALPGVRDVRVATPRGVSTVGQLVITTEPVVTESDGNDTRESAQPVTLPAMLCGRIEKNEDVDWFRFSVDAGSQWCFQVRCMRLEDRVHDLQTHADPILMIRDANGSVIASADNTLAGDPLITYKFERAGDYFLELRDVRYQGNNFWEYCVEVNSHAYIECAQPLAVSAGAASTAQLLGPAGLVGECKLPGQSAHELRKSSIEMVALEPDRRRVALPMVVTTLPIQIEPPQENDAPEKAQPISLPGMTTGAIEKEGDVDCYQFTATKGQKWSFELFARRAGSQLDSHLRILDAKGNQVQLADDMRLGKRNYSDSWIENWSVPADGVYTLEVRDLHLRGGPAFVYAIEAAVAEPMFLLYADTDKTPISVGTTGVLYVRAEKKNGFEGEIQLAVSGLPEGVKAHCGRIQAGKSVDGCIVFEAADVVKPLMTPIEISGTAVVNDHGKDVELKSIATVYQEIYQPGGGRGHWPVSSHVVCVNSPGDLRQVNVSTDRVTLKPGGSATIDVDLVRAEGFDKNVTLEMTYSHLSTIYGSSLPEGVTIDSTASNTLLSSGATKGKLVLKAAASALPIENQQVVVMANVSLNFVMKATYASRPITITVAGGDLTKK